MWLDRETGVLLRNDAFQARKVTSLPEVDASTFFSTKPPPGAKVRRLPAHKGPHFPCPSTASFLMAFSTGPGSRVDPTTGGGSSG
jgi:hypothetical protein